MPIRLLEAMWRAYRKLGCVTVCKPCLEELGAVSLDTERFVDFGVCARCRQLMTHLDEAHWIRP